MTANVDVRRADSRFHTSIGWLESYHSFSFGQHYDPDNVGHGLLLVSNDDVVAPGQGFGRHPHRDMEIVTWVLDGELEHQDSTGTHGVIFPGLVQRMSAGTGVTHSEMNHSTERPVHFVQMWVPPDTAGIDPDYEQLDVNRRLAEGGLVPVASGQGHPGTVRLHQRDAVMYVARMEAGASVDLPAAAYAHLFVAKGIVCLADDVLNAGDAVRFTDLSAALVTADVDSEIIVWAFDSAMT
ncbi:MAG: pirin family protein [Acidimicrobiia bacterium]|nr:pirin family protein [Acidimicrobiia bacterium]